MSEGTLVTALHEALSPAERAMAKNPAGAAQVQEFHRHMYATSSDSLRDEIERIAGMDVRKSTAEIEPASGCLRTGIHNRRRNASFPTCRMRSHRDMEREWIRRSFMKTNF